MINKSEYKLLKRIIKAKPIQTKVFMNQLKSLVKIGYVVLSNPTSTNSYSITYHGYYVTEKGKRAYEEYRDKQRNKIFDWIKYLITTTISIGAFILSIISFCRTL